ncbi:MULTISPECIES: 16S rRNA (guanine(527)-N(7))-methyltransferase RsmG [Clostridium]|uniref:Ribosomal RNA small subunit methyltransferase G n=1 Tax=Clostridium cibarium TaxID=2762247 RepID=A0ABR8PY66_9CLOT|nr:MULTISPECIES: 16S rRNA (guanine(527)-N(7))-methyltransferase RsmG [Clostridium]MBD7913094.1 16S rRNA (guanine(527)-N(7))-methyltransferase RsmG [Clostridium cibarium]
MSFYELMKEASQDVGMSLSEVQYEKFIKYMQLVQEWNKKINLTAIIDDEQFIKKHFIDCIKAFKSDKLKNARNLIDVGTGAGFPGVPIAIMRDDIEVTLLDSLNKRINFLNLVVKELNLTNVVTIHSRAEDGARLKDLRENFDVATSRAVANMTVLSEFCLPYVKVNGYFVALKGPAIDEELKECRNALGVLGGKLEDVIELDIEGTDLKHNIVVVKKTKECPTSYPRKAGIITKKPLK